jgi:hypothetical protein
MQDGHAPGTRLLLSSRLTHYGVEVEGGGGSDVGLEDTLHMAQRVPVLLGVLGRHAIGRDHQVEVAHVGVIGGKADIPQTSWYFHA